MLFFALFSPICNEVGQTINELLNIFLSRYIVRVSARINLCRHTAFHDYLLTKFESINSFCLLNETSNEITEVNKLGYCTFIYTPIDNYLRGIIVLWVTATNECTSRIIICRYCSFIDTI